MTAIAILDDWQQIAERSIDWAPLRARADLAFFHEHFASEDALAAALAPFEGVLVMRERSRFPASLIARLPKLCIISSPGARNASIDTEACTARGILVCNTPATGSGGATAELTLGLLIACARHLATGDAELRAGRFQSRVPPGLGLAGRTLGLIGLGRIGTTMAGYGHALGMKVQAWSPHLTAERCAAAGVTFASKAALLATSDAVSLHIVLSAQTRGLLGAADLARMKRGAILVNTSRGPLIEERALLAALNEGRITAGIDVYDEEPLPPSHPLRAAPNCVLSPHIGYVTEEAMAAFYRLCAENLLAWLDGHPIRVVNPEAAQAPRRP